MADDVAGFTNLMHKYRFVPDLLKNYDADEPVKPEAQAYYAMYLEELATHLGDQRALSDDHKVLQILRNKRVPAVMFQEIHRDRTQEVPDSSDYVDVRMIGLQAAKQLSRSSRTFIERAFWEEMLAWSCDLINERRPVTEDLIGAIERRIRFVAAVNTVVTERNGRRRSFLLADTVDQQLFLQLAECTSCLSKQIAVLQRTSVPARIEGLLTAIVNAKSLFSQTIPTMLALLGRAPDDVELLDLSAANPNVLKQGVGTLLCEVLSCHVFHTLRCTRGCVCPIGGLTTEQRKNIETTYVGQYLLECTRPSSDESLAAVLQLKVFSSLRALERDSELRRVRAHLSSDVLVSNLVGTYQSLLELVFLFLGIEKLRALQLCGGTSGLAIVSATACMLSNCFVDSIDKFMNHSDLLFCSIMSSLSKRKNHPLLSSTMKAHKQFYDQVRPRLHQLRRLLVDFGNVASRLQVEQELSNASKALVSIEQLAEQLNSHNRPDLMPVLRFSEHYAQPLTRTRLEHGRSHQLPVGASSCSTVPSAEPSLVTSNSPGSSVAAPQDRPSAVSVALLVLLVSADGSHVKVFQDMASLRNLAPPTDGSTANAMGLKHFTVPRIRADGRTENADGSVIVQALSQQELDRDQSILQRAHLIFYSCSAAGRVEARAACRRIEMLPDVQSRAAVNPLNCSLLIVDAAEHLGLFDPTKHRSREEVEEARCSLLSIEDLPGAWISVARASSSTTSEAASNPEEDDKQLTQVGEAEAARRVILFVDQERAQRFVDSEFARELFLNGCLVTNSGLSDTIRNETAALLQGEDATLMAARNEYKLYDRLRKEQAAYWYSLLVSAPSVAIMLYLPGMSAYGAWGASAYITVFGVAVGAVPVAVGLGLLAALAQGGVVLHRYLSGTDSECWNHYFVFGKSVWGKWECCCVCKESRIWATNWGQCVHCAELAHKECACKHNANFALEPPNATAATAMSTSMSMSMSSSISSSMSSSTTGAAVVYQPK